MLPKEKKFNPCCFHLTDTYQTYYVQGSMKHANPSGTYMRSFAFFYAFTNKYLKQLKEKCHHYFDKPQKKFNHLLLGINMTQGFQDPRFSRERYKLTGSSFSAWCDMSCREKRHVNLEVEEPRLRPLHIGWTGTVAQEGRLHLPRVNCELLSKLAPRLWFSVPRVPSK